MSDRVTGSPLTWPEGKKRTPRFSRKTSAFGSRQNPVTISRAVTQIYDELARMGINDWQCIISTNLQLRQDGDPRSNQRMPEDPGAAVWWRTSRDKPYTCVASDRYMRVEQNLHAIAKTIEALRGIERWSGAAARDQAFTGFKALPKEPARHWTDVFECSMTDSPELIKKKYQLLRSRAHPDKGGSASWVNEVNEAWERYQADTNV